MSARSRRLLIEGWLSICHSYAVVNQWQLLALQNRSDVSTFFRQVPLYDRTWQSLAGLFSPEQEACFTKLASADPATCDAVYRISFPYNFKEVTQKTAVFITSEYKILIPGQFSDYIDFTARIGSPEVKIVTPSNWSAEGFYRVGCPSDQVLVVPHGVDTALFCKKTPEVRQEMRQRMGLDGFVFMHIGAMTKNKGIGSLLKGFAAVAAKRPEAQLLLKGADNLYRSQQLLKEYLDDLTPAAYQLVADRCRYIGNTISMQDLAAVYQAADAYVSPYLAEGFNMPVLEAMSSGLPVICTKGGSTDDFVQDDYGLRIESSRRTLRVDQAIGEMLQPDQEHLVELMLRVMDDTDWRNSSATKARQRVEQDFTWQRVTDQLLDKLFED